MTGGAGFIDSAVVRHLVLDGGADVLTLDKLAHAANPAPVAGTVNHRLGQKVPPHAHLITFVADRPGHDARYAIDATKLETALGWRAEETFDTSIEKTVVWSLANEAWWRPLRDKVYSGERLGLLQPAGS